MAEYGEENLLLLQPFYGLRLSVGIAQLVAHEAGESNLCRER